MNKQQYVLDEVMQLSSVQYEQLFSLSKGDSFVFKRMHLETIQKSLYCEVVSEGDYFGRLYILPDTINVFTYFRLQ